MDAAPFPTGGERHPGEGPARDATREVLWRVDILAKRLRRCAPAAGRADAAHNSTVGGWCATRRRASPIVLR